MTARRLAAALAILSLLAACTSDGSSVSGVTPTTATTTGVNNGPRPNILVFVTDDQRHDQLAVMRRTRELFGAGGVSFPNAYAQTPLCCPSRASILSGRYTHNHNVRGNTEEWVARFEPDRSIQRELRDAGYQTAIVGKLFDGWPLATAPPYFDRFAIMQGGYDARTPVNIDGVVAPAAMHTGQLVSDQAVAMMRDFQRDASRPWFLYVAPFAPHFPYDPTLGDGDAAVGAMPDIPALREIDRSDKPPWVRDHVNAAGGARPQDIWARQARSLLSVDRTVAKLVEAAGPNTLAVFVSDNGYMLGEHGISEDNRLPYTPSIHVPLLVRWPERLKRGRVDTRLVTPADIAPTIAEAARLPRYITDRMDGRSLLGRHRRTRLLLENFFSRENARHQGYPEWTSLRTRSAQYTEWRGPEGTLLYRELYDLARDPAQLDNLLATAGERVAARAARMAADLQRLRACAGTTGVYACP